MFCKTSASKECISCHYQQFLDKEFKIESIVCNGSHDKLIMSIDINRIAIVNIYSVDYRVLLLELAKMKQIY